MAQVDRSQAIGRIVKELRLRPGFDQVPSQVQTTIVPTFDVGTQLSMAEGLITEDIIVRSGQATTTNATTGIYVTQNQEGRDFFFTGYQISYVKDGTADNADAAGPTLNFAIDGTTQSIELSVLTLTAQNFSSALTFPFPIKIDRGTSITINNATFTVGKSVCNCTIFGYITDTV